MAWPGFHQEPECRTRTMMWHASPVEVYGFWKHGVWLVAPAPSRNTDPARNSHWWSQRGKIPLNCSHNSRFPLNLMGLGLHTFPSRNDEAAPLGTLCSLPVSSEESLVKMVAFTIFLHLHLPCHRPTPTPPQGTQTTLEEKTMFYS